MKVSEIRDITKKLDKSVIVELLVKTYRHVPKEKKEELDQMILSGNPKVTTKKSEEIKTAEDFNDIKAPIEFFIENAYEGNYLKPNRIINKSRRSKWRFEAKKAYKCLTDISENDINYTDAGKLLQSLYDVLSYGCGCWIFASDDTFRAMGVLQTDFFRVVCEKRLRTGVNKDTIGALLSSIMKGFTDRETLNIELYAVLASLLKTSDAKYLAIEAASEIIKSIKKDIALEEERQKGKRFKSYGIKWYKETENINDLCEFVEILSLYLGDKEEGSDFFWKNQTEDDKEIALFRLLNIIALFSGDFPEWCRVYEEEIDEKGAAFPEDIAFINQALGCLYIDMAKYSEAYDLLLDSYVLFEKQYGSKSPYTICSEANMCHYYYAVGDYDRCLLEKQKILDNNENVTEYSNYFKLTLNDIEACIAKDRGEIVNSYNKYNENLKICMEIMEKNDETPMFIKSFFIKTLESLGDTSYQLDSAKYTESSIKFYDLAIQNLDKIQDTGKYSDSYRSCLVIKKEMLSQESEESAKKISDAIKKLEDIYEADDSYPVLIEPFLSYGELLGFVTGNETEAINYYEKAHKIAEKAYGYNHPLNGKIFESEGRYYSNKIHDNETALNKSQQGLEICKNLLIENSRLAASLYISLAGEYKALGDDKKSEEYLEKGKDVLEKLGSRFLTQDEIKEASQN